MPFSPPHDSKPIAFRISILPANRAPQTQRDTATRSLPQTDRLPNPQTCRPPKAPGAGKSPFLLQEAGSVHAPAADAFALPPARMPAHVRAHMPPSTRALASPLTELAVRRASPSFPYSTLQTDPAAASGFPPPETGDHPPAAVDCTPETIGTCCNARPAPDTFEGRRSSL